MQYAEGGVRFTLSEAGGCTLAGSVLTSGDDSEACMVEVTATGNSNYKSKTGMITVTLTEKETQMLYFAADSVTKTYGDGTFRQAVSGAMKQ